MADDDAESIGRRAFDALGNLVFYKSRIRTHAKEFFWRKVAIVGSCWEWTGGLAGGGYGHFMYYAAKDWIRQVPSHRFVWEMLYGPIPDGLLVCHTCDNRKCVRPSHLWLGTDQDNADDKMRKGRDNLKSRRWDPVRTSRAQAKKLTARSALDIRERRRNGASVNVLAGEYGVSRSLIYQIATGRRWVTAEVVDG